MEYIFLDIDGVLNAPSDKEIVFDMMEVNKLNMFIDFVIKISATVVITSSRRIYRDEVEKIKLALFKCHKVTLLSEKRLFKHRGSEIEYYIKQNNIRDFVIFDDNDDEISTNDNLKDHFVLVDYITGLTKDDLIKALNILHL